MFANSLSRIDYLDSPENTDISLADYSFFTTDTLSESASPMSELILASNSYSHLRMISPANIFIPSDKTLSYSTPFTSYPNLDKSTLPNSELDTAIALPIPIFAPRFDKGILCYPTPPSFNVKELSVR
jgi:hypothetical protein